MKTKREQILEILEKIGTPISFEDVNSQTFWLEEAADEILALPLEVPSDEEIINAENDYGKKHQEDQFGYSIYDITSFAFRQGAMWMRDEIIKLNQK